MRLNETKQLLAENEEKMEQYVLQTFARYFNDILIRSA